MEDYIQKLDHDTDEATKAMLQKLVEKKRKYDGLKKIHLFIMWLTIFLTFVYTYWFYKQVAVPYNYSFAAMFSVLVQENVHLYAMLLIIGSFGFMNILKQKKEKAEKEFHELRCEIIDKSKDLWKKEEAWKNRHQVFNMMKQQYDINLFHETK
ncbi:DUF2663 family protein [Niallia sp. 01092]|uniref:DUF2663 family protein n=1 Tax=unclassified Niallia TaxID=2837522 RepID=UPI003FCFF435